MFHAAVQHAVFLLWFAFRSMPRDMETLFVFTLILSRYVSKQAPTNYITRFCCTSMQQGVNIKQTQKVCSKNNSEKFKNSLDKNVTKTGARIKHSQSHFTTSIDILKIKWKVIICSAFCCALHVNYQTVCACVHAQFLNLFRGVGCDRREKNKQGNLQ